MNWPAEPCILEGVPAADYHSDSFGDVPTLSRSVAHALITDSPRHAAASHLRLPGMKKRRATKEMDQGSLVHALLAGDVKDLSIHDVPDWRGKRADIRDAAREDGKTPIRLSDYKAAEDACVILRPEICRVVEELLVNQGVDLGGRNLRWEDFAHELVVLWTESDLYAGDARRAWRARCRARLDLFLAAFGVILDFKIMGSGSAGEADSEAFIRRINNWREPLGIQAGCYPRGVEAAIPELAGRTQFIFLRIEVYPPFSVVPILVPEGMRSLGEARWLRGVAGWAKCLASGVWPGPGPAVAHVESWAAEREMERQAEGGGDGD